MNDLSGYLRYSKSLKWTLSLAGLVMALAISMGQPAAQTAEKVVKLSPPRPMIVMPIVDAQRGRRLFVAKGCVSCHSVSGVGGKAAPALDAEDIPEPLDVLDFAARMWRGSLAMQELQELEFGYRIELSGDEIGDLAAFVASPDAQESFSIDEVPHLLRDWFIDEIYWGDGGDWPVTREWRFPQ